MGGTGGIDDLGVIAEVLSWVVQCGIVLLVGSTLTCSRSTPEKRRGVGEGVKK